MKSTNLILRRTHLYLGMLLIPWLLVYALSAALLNHGEHFRQFKPTDPQFVPLWEKDYTLTTPVDGDHLREAAEKILSDNQITGPFGIQRQGQRLNINVQNFMQPTRLTYDHGQKKLRAEKKKFAWVEVLTRLHFRAGYNGNGFLVNLWPFIVDVFCITMIIWILTGLYLWWKIRVSRLTGWITLSAGALTLAALLATL